MYIYMTLTSGSPVHTLP